MTLSSSNLGLSCVSGLLIKWKEATVKVERISLLLLAGNVMPAWKGREQVTQIGNQRNKK